MHYIPYNSRREYHKKPFGAVAAGTEVEMRIVLPREYRAESARLVVRADGSDRAERVEMRWERMEGAGEEWWQVVYTPAEPGLYWYRFEFGTPGGSFAIFHAGHSLGKIGAGGTEWQLTVYDPQFETPAWLEGGVIYQIFADRFYNSGTKKRGVPGDRLLRSDWGGDPVWEPDDDGSVTVYDYFGGDLQGITEKLWRLEELSVTCLYLNPVFEAHSSHRYDTADYFRIDPLLGTEEDFRRLCEEAAKRGIRVVLDGVFSHTGADSRYFNKNNRYPDCGAYNSPESPYFHWYTFRRWPDDYACWWGVEILPEIREEDPGFAEFITGEDGVARRWLRLGAGGWRLDVADELPDGFLDALRAAVKSEKADAFILGEVWEDATNKISYGNRRRYLLGGQLDSVMNYPFAGALMDFAAGGNGEDFFETVLGILENYPPPAVHTLMNHIGTHDTVRALTRLAGEAGGPQDRFKRDKGRLSEAQREAGLALLKMAAAVQFTLPGVPSVYYGDEAGMEGGHDPFNRGCYPWGLEDESLLAHYRILGKMRENCLALANGRFVPVQAGKDSVAFIRESSVDAVMTLANRGESETHFALPPGWENARALLGDAPGGKGTLRVPARSAAVLKTQRKRGEEKA